MMAPVHAPVPGAGTPTKSARASVRDWPVGRLASFLLARSSSGLATCPHGGWGDGGVTMVKVAVAGCEAAWVGVGAARLLDGVRAQREQRGSDRDHVADDADDEGRQRRDAHPRAHRHAATQLDGREHRDEHEDRPVGQAGASEEERNLLAEVQVLAGGRRGERERGCQEDGAGDERGRATQLGHERRLRPGLVVGGGGGGGGGGGRELQRRAPQRDRRRARLQQRRGGVEAGSGGEGGEDD